MLRRWIGVVVVVFAVMLGGVGGAASDEHPMRPGGGDDGATEIVAGTARAPAGGEETLSTHASAPAPPRGNQNHTRPPDPDVRTSTSARVVSEAPTLPQTTAQPGGPEPAAPSDFRVFRDSTLDLTANLTSSTDEPSVAQAGNTVFMTGNWWAAISRNGGQSFSHVDPYSAFGGGYGGFCCDQVTTYSAEADATVWVLQYARDASGSNAERVAVSVGEPDLQAVSFSFVDITPQQIGQPTGVWADFPHIAVTDGHLYLTYNMFSGSSYVGTAINRAPLGDLVDGGGLRYEFFTTDLGTTLPVSGAGSTMYLGSHVDNDTLRVWSWPDGSNTFTAHDVNHSAFNRGPYTCTTNDGFDPCGRSDARVRGGWAGNGILGFAWDASGGAQGLGNFPYPYTFVVRVDEATFALIDEPIVWNSSFAWFYGSFAANGRGHVGVTIGIAGGGTYPGARILIADDIGGPWQGGFFVANGTNSPGANRWGDYLTTRAVNGDGNAWVGASYVLDGPCPTGGADCNNVRVHYTVFGRERDYANCPDDSFEPDNAFDDSLELDPTATSTGHAFCSTDDEDWFRFSGTAGHQYRSETLNLGGHNDTVLTLYDSSLTQVAVDDDGGIGLASRIDYVAPRSGTYYLKSTRSGGSRDFAYTYDLRITRDLPPVVTAPVTGVRQDRTMHKVAAGKHDVALRDRWTRTDPDGIASQDLEECRNVGCSFTDVSPRPSAHATSYDYRLPIGTKMRRRIQVFDSVGAFGPWTAGPRFSLRGVQQDRNAFSYGGRWTTRSNKASYGGTFTTTAGRPGTRAILRFKGRSVGLVGSTRSNGGKAKVFLDGDRQAVVDYYAKKAQDRRIVFAAEGLAPSRPDGSAHVLEIRWLRKKTPASSGRNLFVDGAVTLR